MIEHHFSEGLYAKQMFIPKGAMACQHQHNYDHLSILAQGKVRVLLDDDKVEEYTAPACINIVKNVNHVIVALEDSTWFCIHQTEETDVNKVDQVLIKGAGSTVKQKVEA
jgi:quercetin dioxygenase-like cupin family protein